MKPAGGSRRCAAPLFSAPAISPRVCPTNQVTDHVLTAVSGQAQWTFAQQCLSLPGCKGLKVLVLFFCVEIRVWKLRPFTLSW